MPQFLTAGSHEFVLRFCNLFNPHNHEDVLVKAYIIYSYAKVVIDSESSNYEAETAETESKQGHVAFLPSITVPAPQEAPHCRDNFWFSVRNVYDEDISVKLSSQKLRPFDHILELLLMLRSANTPSTIIAPGESVDICVVFHVLPSALLSADTWSSGCSGATSEILELGRVSLDISIHTVEEAAQRKEIDEKGKLLPGKTFMLSASSLYFFATAIKLPANIPADQLPSSLKSKAGGGRNSCQVPLPGKLTHPTCVLHQLRNSSESFWVRNRSPLEVLNFVIRPVSMYQPGLGLVEGSTEVEISTNSEWIQAVATPSSGTIAPGESVKGTVHLEEAAPTSTDVFRDETDGNQSGKMTLLHKMRHKPPWRSNSWDANGLESLSEESGRS